MVYRRRLKVRHFVSGFMGWLAAIAFVVWLVARMLRLPFLENVGLGTLGCIGIIWAWMFRANLIERRWSLSAGRRSAGRFSVIVIWMLLRCRTTITIRLVDRWLA